MSHTPSLDAAASVLWDGISSPGPHFGRIRTTVIVSRVDVYVYLLAVQKMLTIALYYSCSIHQCNQGPIHICPDQCRCAKDYAHGRGWRGDTFRCAEGILPEVAFEKVYSWRNIVRDMSSETWI